MTWHLIMGFISSLALLVPLILILALRLSIHKSFLALLIYYFSTFSYNLMNDGIIPVSDEVMYSWGLINNLIDTPLMLYFMTYFCASKKQFREQIFLITGFIFFEMIVLMAGGFNIQSITLILGPGMALVVVRSLILFVRFAKTAFIHQKATGKAFMATAVLFAYGCYAFIYLMYYILTFNLDEQSQLALQSDTFLLYFVVTTLSSVLMSIGMIFERKRVHVLNELKITRKELSEIYNDEFITGKSSRVMLDFKKEAWNQ